MRGILFQHRHSKMREEGPLEKGKETSIELEAGRTEKNKSKKRSEEERRTAFLEHKHRAPNI
jgi:hypothetical protein